MPVSIHPRYKVVIVNVPNIVRVADKCPIDVQRHVGEREHTCRDTKAVLAVTMYRQKRYWCKIIFYESCIIAEYNLNRKVTSNLIYI